MSRGWKDSRASLWEEAFSEREVGYLEYSHIREGAGKVHIGLLRIIAGLLTIHLWLLPISGVWLIWLMKKYGIFCDFLYYIRQPGSIVSIILFAVLYVGLLTWLCWLCVLCKRLRIARRVAVWCLLWIPVLNYGLAVYVRGLARQEIDHHLHKIQLDDVRVERKICSTKYPFLLVHGVGFRDFHYFNYWGRIPRELVRNGARVYYGHQEAWGTVEDNGLILKDKIMEILRETGCEKVNIIAHSKGGLDARYVISGLRLEECVASLTTINTPHRGSKLVDFLKRIPDPVYRRICGMIDRYFGRLGDIKPDAYRASFQLSCVYAEEFNQKYPDSSTVYYQSYASLMKSGFSSKLLCIPYWILKALDAPNDGLVTVESAKWADFKGVVRNTRLRGISHGDMIDLTREDYQDFDVVEFYIQLVKELKEMGF